MKILKLIAIAVGILAVVVGALWLSNGGSSSTAPTSVNDKTRALQKQVSELYNGATEWNKQEYDKLTTDIAQYAADDIISSEEKTLLINHLDNAATNSVHALLLAEFHSTDCSAAEVEALMTGVHFLLTKMEKDRRLTELEAIDKLYKEIRRFIAGSFRFTPDFNGHSWTSHATRRTAALNTRDSYRARADYRNHLSNIAELSTGLSAVEGKISAGRNDYYNALERKIEQYFDKQIIDEAVYQDLLRVYGNFANEAGEISAKTRLMNYYRDHRPTN